MAKIVPSMSRDRLMTGPNDDMEHTFGLNGHRLNAWLSDGERDRSRTGPSGAQRESARADGHLAAVRWRRSHAGRKIQRIRAGPGA